MLVYCCFGAYLKSPLIYFNKELSDYFSLI